MADFSWAESATRQDAIDEIVAQIDKKLKHAEFTVAVSHDNYLVSVGGVQAYMLDEQDALAARKISYIQLYPTQPLSRLADASEDLRLSLNVDSVAFGDYLASEVARFLGALSGRRGRSCVSIQIHQLLGWHLNAVTALIRVLRPKRRFFWVHDHFSICTQFSLLLNGRRFCNAPAPESNACTICRYGAARRRALPQFRRFFRTHSFAVAAPSRFTLNLWCREFPGVATSAMVVPHLKLIERQAPSETRSEKVLDPDYRPRLAFVGHPLAMKGWKVWRRFVDREAASGGYDLYHFGSRAGEFSERFVPVSVTRENREAMINALRAHEIDIVLLWSIGPETFCYVLHEATAAGCFVLAHADSGNVADYVSSHGNGLVLESDERLLEFLGDREKVRFYLAVFHRQHPRRYDVTRNLAVPAMIAGEGEQQEGSTEGIPPDALLYFDRQQLSSQGPIAGRKRKTA